MNFLRDVILFLVISIFPLSKGSWSVTLDTESDIFRAWKLKGEYSYYPTGAQLKILKEKIPNDFPFNNFKDARGVWAILFNPYTTNEVSEGENKNYNFHDENGTAIAETRASFTYISAAQLLTSISLRYYIQGDAKILIRKTEKGFPFYTISASSTVSYEWVEMTIAFPSSNMIMVEAHVLGKEEFVIIDRIEVFYQETTHPTRRSTTVNTTTVTPIINKATDIKSCALISLLSYLFINILLSKLRI